MRKTESSMAFIFISSLAFSIVLFLAGLTMHLGCATAASSATPSMSSHPGKQTPILTPLLPNKKSPVIIEVNGKKLMRERFDFEVKKALTAARNQSSDKDSKQLEKFIRKAVVNDFVSRKLLEGEIAVRGIKATGGEVAEQIDNLRKSLPASMSFNDFLKNKNLKKEDLEDKIGFSIKVDKLISLVAEGKLKPTKTEINDFYKKNREKFKVPEMVHVRHILIAKGGSDDKTKSEKKAKAESLRKQLIEGSDFAALAGQNSECPSKNNGGDLGWFTKGQMVKPFEDAAFSQKANDIGPVVETDIGYHVIQVLDHKSTGVAPLNDELKKRITYLLEQKKRQAAMINLLKELQKKAKIIAYEKF